MSRRRGSTRLNDSNEVVSFRRRSRAIIEGLEAGAHTHRFVENGLRAKLKLPDGRVLTHDAGSITYEVSFDAAGEFVGVEVISVHGPHPAFDSGVWCDTAIEAFGL
jgi:hypothetical protein